MSERKLAGKDILFFIDPAGGTDYSTVVCLTSQTYARTKNTIDATTKCGPDTLNGTATRTASIEGVVLYGPEAGKVSEYALDDYWENDTVVGWKMAEVTPLGGSIVYQGVGKFSELTTVYGQDGAATFSATLQITGTPTKILVPDITDIDVALGTIAATTTQIIGLDLHSVPFKDTGLTATVWVVRATVPATPISTPVVKAFSGDSDGLFDTPYNQTALTTATQYIAKVELSYGGIISTPFTTA